MSCSRYRDLLSRYIDGEVTPRQRRELLAHVENCRDCAAWLARVRQTDVLLKGVPENSTFGPRAPGRTWLNPKLDAAPQLRKSHPS